MDTDYDTYFLNVYSNNRSLFELNVMNGRLHFPHTFKRGSTGLFPYYIISSGCKHVESFAHVMARIILLDLRKIILTSITVVLKFLSVFSRWQKFG